MRKCHNGLWVALIAASLSLTSGCDRSKSGVSGEQAPATTSTRPSQAYRGELAADDGQWTRPAKDYASTRYSTLDQINTANVKNLRVAWTFTTGMDRGHEAAPLYVNGTLYVITPWPNTLFALDAKDGSLKWQYNPNPSPSAKGEACCDWVNRGAVFADGKVIYNTLDGYTVAIDAGSGKMAWKGYQVK